MFPSRLAVVALIPLTILVLHAQDPASLPDGSLNRGIYPTGSYSNDDIEAINNVTGVVTLTIPLATLPPGKGGSSFGVSAVYNSSIFDNKSSIQNGWLKQELVPSTAGGWRYGFQYSVGWDKRPTAGATTCQLRYLLYRAFLAMPDGSRKYLRLIKSTDTTGDTAYNDLAGYYQPISPIGGLPDCLDGYPTPPPLTPTTKIIYATVDSSYIRIEVMPYQKTWTIFMPEGTIVQGSMQLDANGAATDASGGSFKAAPYSAFPLFLGTPQTITDRNGNAIQINPVCSVSGPCTTTITDDLNATFPSRKVVITYGSTQDTITWLGPPQVGLPVNTLTARVNHSSFTLPSHDYDCAFDPNPIPANPLTCQANQLTIRRVDSISLPSPTSVGGTGREYTFSTDCTTCTAEGFAWGEIHSWTASPALNSVNSKTVSYTYSFDTKPRQGRELLNAVGRKSMSYSRPSDDISANTLITVYARALYPLEGKGTVVVTAPNDAHTTYTYLLGSSQTEGLLSGISYPDSSSVQFAWAQNALPGTPAAAPANPYVKAVAKGRANNGQYSGTIYTIDKNGNLLTADEYDLQNGPIAGLDATLGLTTAPLVRKTARQFYVSTQNDIEAYWSTSAKRHLRAVKSALVGAPSGAVVAASHFQYDNPETTGNLNQLIKWDSDRGSYPGSLGSPVSPPACSAESPDNCGIRTSWTHACNGSVNSVIDPNGNGTGISYDSSCLYPTQVATGGLITSYAFDGASGYLQSTTDVGNSITTTLTYDLTGRLTKSKESAGGIARSVLTQYDDSNLIVRLYQDKTNEDDAQLVTSTRYDPFGRVRLITDPSGNTVKKGYFPCGTQSPTVEGFCSTSYELTSNPYTTTSDVSMGWTLVSTNVAGPFNGGSNVPSQQVQHFSGAAPPISFSNNVTTLGGNSALTGTATLTESSHQEQLTAMDEAGVTHIYKFDGLGRMSEADGVLYTYDTLDNLQGVSGQPRTFTFSSLSRLVQATNPESTTTSYKYDFNGNVLSMTDGQGRATCFGTWTGSACDSSQYGYDPLNRPRKKSYSDGTPIVTYTYDQDIKGALYSVETTAQNKTTYTRDSLGRITGSAQITAGSSPYTFTYSYDRADFLTSMTYPSGRIVNYTPNNANQVAAIADPNKAQPYATNIQYSASGTLTQMTFGNSRTEARDLNARLQTQMIALCPGTTCGSRSLPLAPSTQNFLNLQLGYSPTANNGNITSQTVSALGAFSFTQSYEYDAKSRLNKVTEGSWSQTYNYDSASLGNRWVTQTPGYSSMWPPALSVSPFTPTQSQHYQSATNQINVPAPTTHDNAGNQTNIGGWTYTYDAEGRMLSATIAPSNRTQYVYDGEGQRVMKLACASTAPCTAATAVAKTVYVYDAGGNLAAEYPDSLGTPPCTTCYVTVDQLGSTRVLTDGSGSVVRRYDFMPFGEEIPADGSVRTAGNGYQSGWDGFTTKFTGQMRDSETGLDYFHARYYSAVQGRFLSPDPANIGADILDPQTWNGYAYVANSPMAFVDPLGLQSLSVGGNCTVCHVGNVPSFHSATPPPPPPAPSFSTVGGVTYSSPVTLGLRYTGYTTEVSLGNRIIYSPGAEVDYATDLMMVAPFRALLGARGAAAAAAAGAAEGLAERSVWNTLAPTLRGRVIETMLGGNLPRTFPVIDKFFNGLATSIKSMDLRLATYLNPAKLESALMGHVDKLAGFSGGQLGTTVVRNVTSRALEVAVPNGAMNAAQRAVFTKVAAQAAEKGIKVIVIPIR